MKKTKRIIATILAFVFVFSILPTSAFAATPDVATLEMPSIIKIERSNVPLITLPLYPINGSLSWNIPGPVWSLCGRWELQITINGTRYDSGMGSAVGSHPLAIDAGAVCVAVGYAN